MALYGLDVEEYAKREPTGNEGTSLVEEPVDGNALLGD
jgi:hypothetical protein